MGTMIIKGSYDSKTKIQQLIFDNSTAEAVLTTCLESLTSETSKCLPTAEVLKFAPELQIALEWSMSGTKTHEKIETLGRMEKGVEKLKKYARELRDDDIQELLEELETSIFFRLGLIKSAKLNRDFRAQAADQDIEASRAFYREYLNEALDSESKIRDTLHKPIYVFLKRFNKAFFHKSGKNEFLAIFYRDYFHPQILGNEPLEKELAIIYRDHIAPRLSK